MYIATIGIRDEVQNYGAPAQCCIVFRIQLQSGKHIMSITISKLYEGKTVAASI